MPKTITISFDLDIELVRETLKNAAFNYGLLLRDDITDEQIAERMSEDFKTYLDSDTLEEWFDKGINCDVYNHFLEEMQDEIEEY